MAEPGTSTPTIPQRPRMPPPDVYESEYSFWPWGKLLGSVADWIAAQAPPSSVVVDYMCGTGFLLNQVSKRRPDLRLEGCSLDPEYLEYAKVKYPNIRITLADALDYSPSVRPQLVVSTGGIHHLSRHEQAKFVEKVATELHDGGSFVVGEEILPPYTTEGDRLSSVVELGTALLRHLVDVSAPRAILQTAIEVLANDIQELEYKFDLSRLLTMLEAQFLIKDSRLIWPHIDATFGDIVIICQKVPR